MLQDRINGDEFVERVYLTAVGLIEPSQQMPEVNDLFAPGQKCGQLYTQIRAAYTRICSRLGGIEEDSDLNEILNLSDHICRLVGMEMFRCGTHFQQTSHQ